jgi:hypothetical protein
MPQVPLPTGGSNACAAAPVTFAQTTSARCTLGAPSPIAFATLCTTLLSLDANPNLQFGARPSSTFADVNLTLNGGYE